MINDRFTFRGICLYLLNATNLRSFRVFLKQRLVLLQVAQLVAISSRWFHVISTCILTTIYSLHVSCFRLLVVWYIIYSLVCHPQGISSI